MDNKICFDYERLFGLKNAVGAEVMQDLVNKFGHVQGAYIADDAGGRKTAYALGQQSVINYIIAQLNIARQKTE